MLNRQAAVPQKPVELGYATCVTIDNPFAPYENKVTKVLPGTFIKDIAPNGKFPYACRYVRGDRAIWITRESWECQVGPGARVEFYAVTQGGGGGSDVGRTVLMIAAIYIAIQFGQSQFAASIFGSTQAATAVSIFAATSLVNLLVPVQAPDAPVLGGGTSASNSYSSSLSGNQFRLEEPIPVLYGRNKTYPSFAGEAYNTYDENDDQFYQAVLCIGEGEFNIEAVLVDDTDLSSFQDVLVNRVLPPGTLPTSVSARMVNAIEVAGGDIQEGRYIGPVTGCKPRHKVTKVFIDIGLSRGLAQYNATTGDPEPYSVEWRVEYRAVDDYGSGSLTDPPGVWTILAVETLELAQTEAVRRTYEYELPTAIRPQIRLTRITPFDGNNRVANNLEWIGLRCELADPAPLSATATHVEIVMRGSSQLSQLSQRKLAVISRRKLRTWSPGGGWTAPVETRSIAWAIADKWTNTVYGDKYEDARCDLEGLYRLDQVWAARQDRFDGVFDQTVDSRQADQMIAQAGRAAVIQRNTIMTVVRDEAQTIPVTAFNSRNIAPGSVKISYKLADESTPDGIIVEYWNNRTWDWDDSIVVPAPGVVTPVRPQRLRLFGITGAKHAEREGVYNAWNSVKRRKIQAFDTELEGMIPSFGSAVVFNPSLPGWSKHGDVVSYDTVSRLLVATEPFSWSTASVHYLSLINADGSLSTPYPVTKGPDDFSAYLSVAPSAALVTDLANRERTRYAFGAGTPYPSILRVLSITNSGDETGVRTYQVSGLAEDDSVHTADNYLLPTEGEIQDPVEPTADPGGGPGGLALVPYLRGQQGSVPDSNGDQRFFYYVGFEVDGKGYGGEQVPAHGMVYEAPARIPSWWLLGAGPFGPADVAQFEIRATYLGGTEAPAGSAVDTWLDFSVPRYWTLNATGLDEVKTSNLLIEIRAVSGGIVQASTPFYLNAYGPISPGGGGDGA